MAALTTIIAAASVAAGVAGTAVQMKQQKKAEKQAQQAARANIEEAKNAATIEKKKGDDPKIKVGSATPKTGANARKSSLLGAGAGAGKAGGL